VTEDTEAFRQIIQGFERHELDAGVNPWDTVCKVFNDPEFKPPAHKITSMYPDLRGIDPSTIVGKNVPAGNLMEKWKQFKTHLTRWLSN